MNKDVLYDDKDVTIREDCVIIKCYFFPIGTSKKITYDKIQRVEMRNFAWKGKMWGMSATEWGYWMPGDLSRWDYDKYIAVYTDSSITPSFTCKDMDRAYQILTRQLAKYRENIGGSKRGSSEGENMMKQN